MRRLFRPLHPRPVRPVALSLLVAAVAVAGVPASTGQSGPPKAAAPAKPEAPAAVTAAQLRTAIDTLGSIEFPVRTAAARTVRRADAAIAVPALLQAVKQHADQYVRFRALVVLSGFNDSRTRDVMAAAILDKNDRLRTVAYSYFERNPDKLIVPRLLEALKVEESEFVRPSLTRALAAHGDDPRVQPVVTGLVMQGQAFFRSVVIEALGDHRATYALKPILEVAKIDGPLQDDAALALGKIGDKSALPVLAAMQRTAPRERQPSIAAAICLLGVNCSSHQTYIVDTLRFSIINTGFQSLVRSSASGLATLALSGRGDALTELIAQGGPTHDPVRAPIALAVGTVALRNTPVLLKVLEQDVLRDPGIELLREAFDMLEEDFEEERFFALVRRTYWQAPAGSPARAVIDTLIRKLEF
jgi:HEAT repeat protein